MAIRINTLLIAAAIIMVACNGGNTQKSENEDSIKNQNQAEQEKAEQTSKALPFPDVQIPTMISEQGRVLEYLAENYWTGITDPARDYLCDSAYVSGVDKDIVEQKFADWTMVLNNVSLQAAIRSVERLYDRSYACEKQNPASNVFETFVMLTEKYFYDPNSPMRNEEYYLPFVARYASYEGLSELDRGRFERVARLCALNRVGTKAVDFRFADKSGTIRHLYDLEAPFTLLFFSNPGCEACMEIITVLKDNPSISSLIKQGVLKVVNIYIDEDIQAWRSYMPIYPTEWYNGFDPDFVLRSNEMYNIRAIPSLYLLDKEKNVLLKDVPEDVLFNYLFNLRY